MKLCVCVAGVSFDVWQEQVQHHVTVHTHYKKSFPHELENTFNGNRSVEYVLQAMIDELTEGRTNACVCAF